MTGGPIFQLIIFRYVFPNFLFQIIYLASFIVLVRCKIPNLTSCSKNNKDLFLQCYITEFKHKFFHYCLHEDKDVYFKARCSSVVEVCWQGCIQALSAPLLSLSSVTLDTCYQSYPHLPTRTSSISSPAIQISCPLLSIIIGLLSPPNLVISERIYLLY